MAINQNCCLCYGDQVGSNPCVPTTSDPCPTNCLYAPSIVVSESNSVYPCGEAGLIPFDNLDFGTTICGENALTYSIVTYSAEVTSVSITSDGIAFTSTDAAADTLRATITYRLDCGGYATMGNVTIIFKSRCANVLCAAGFNCNGCTGDCDPIDVDISIEAGSDNPIIDLQIT